MDFLHWIVFVFQAGISLVAMMSNSLPTTLAALDELSRVAQYDERYPRKWPPKDYIPGLEGWKNLHEHRFSQIREMELDQGKYEGYMQSVFAAFLIQNFTEFGFGLARAPAELTAALQEGIRGGLERGEERFEHEVEVIEGARTLFIDRPDLTQRVLEELQPYTEAWAGMELTPHVAYGFRLYQNSSVLNMHVDKKQTHIVSMIYHIDSSDDSEDWPIYIEDFHGRTHEVVLAPGDILFYESAKCLHGRPKMFNGGWYSSIFIHYYPASGWQNKDHVMEAHYIIPPDWTEVRKDKKETPLKMVGTSFKELMCPNTWCGTENAVKWSKKGEDGWWIDPNGVRHIFEPKLFSSGEEL